MELEDGWLIKCLSCKHEGLSSDPWQACKRPGSVDYFRISVLDREQEDVTDLLSSQSS